MCLQPYYGLSFGFKLHVVPGDQLSDRVKESLLVPGRLRCSDNAPRFLGHAECVCAFPVCPRLCVCVLFIIKIPVSSPISNERSFLGTCSDHFWSPKSSKDTAETADTHTCLTRACVHVCSRALARACLLAVCQGAKLFWIGPSHLVTIAETDRGAVGQSGVGVLNELSCIQTASVSRGMNEWPDSLFTSSFLSDFPDLSLPPPLLNFVTLLSPQILMLCIFVNISLSLSPHSTSHFSCLLLFPLYCLYAPFSPFFFHSPLSSLKVCFGLFSWAIGCTKLTQNLSA